MAAAGRTQRHSLQYAKALGDSVPRMTLLVILSTQDGDAPGEIQHPGYAGLCVDGWLSAYWRAVACVLY